MQICIEHLMLGLLLNLGSKSLEAANNALASRGYAVATCDGLTADQLLTLSPEVLATEATPSNLRCCAMIRRG
jgi:hypothetical protein